MRTETAFESEANPEDPTTPFARYLLTAERILMGLILLGFGVSGLLNLLPDSSMPDGAATLGGVLMHAGFAYPLLKGVEVLLELYVGNRDEALRYLEGEKRAVTDNRPYVEFHRTLGPTRPGPVPPLPPGRRPGRS